MKEATIYGDIKEGQEFVIVGHGSTPNKQYALKALKDLNIYIDTATRVMHEEHTHLVEFMFKSLLENKQAQLITLPVDEVDQLQQFDVLGHKSVSLITTLGLALEFSNIIQAWIEKTPHSTLRYLFKAYCLDALDILREDDMYKLEAKTDLASLIKERLSTAPNVPDGGVIALNNLVRELQRSNQEDATPGYVPIVRVIKSSQRSFLVTTNAIPVFGCEVITIGDEETLSLFEQAVSAFSRIIDCSDLSDKSVLATTLLFEGTYTDIGLSAILTVSAIKTLDIPIHYFAQYPPRLRFIAPRQ